jgi:hypothetical protein
MIEGLSPLVKKLGKALVFIALLMVPLSLASAQQSSQIPKPRSAERDRDDDKEPVTPVEEELKAKRAIKFADKEYQENLDRARNLSSLSTAIATSYKQKSRLDPEDIKKLEKIEKLAKGIRSAAGGSEDDFQMEKPPKDLPAAVEMLTDLSESLKARVEKTPKHVISAAVIDQANVLLELVRIVRTLPS